MTGNHDHRIHLSRLISLRLLLLPFAGLLIFLTGISVARHHSLLHFGLIILGVLVVLAFYFLTFAEVIVTLPEDPYKKIFWVVAIACVPIAGNVVYVIFHEMAMQRQQPHGVW